MRVYQSLTALGFKIWFDEIMMEGSIVDQMVSGIDSSALVMVGITQRYMEKVGGDNKNDNCQVEFGYAQRKKSASKMIAVPMESRCKTPSDWSGPVGMFLGGELYVADFAFNIDARSKLYEDNIRKLAERINSLCSRQSRWW